MITITHGDKSLAVAHLDCVRFRLEFTRRGRRSSSVEIWTKTLPIEHAPTFAESRRVEDLIPVRLVEVVEEEWGARRNTWTMGFTHASCVVGELLIEVKYSEAESKSWPLQRCLMGLGWKHETTYGPKKETPQ